MNHRTKILSVILFLGSIITISLVYVSIVDSHDKAEHVRLYLKQIVGGTAIQQSGGFCTSGFIVSFINQHNNVINGIVTAGHCLDESKSARVPSSTVYGNTDKIGNIYDTLLDNIDIGLIKLYDNKYNFQVGNIAKPLMYNESNKHIKSQTSRYSDFLILDSDYFRIVNWKNPEKNQIVYKMGQTTGLTKGIVLDDCVNPRLLYSNRYVIEYNCLVKYSIYDKSGDSGAPVFSIINDNDVILHGVHIAANIFVPIETIIKQLFIDNGIKLHDVWIGVYDGDDIF